MLFKVTNKDNRGNAIFIQGAYSQSTSNDIAAIVFQNYDEDTKAIYSMAGISARDAFGNASSNGEGELLFSTNLDGNSNLSEQMRIKYNGDVCIGCNVPLQNSLLSVYGNLGVTSNISVSNNFYVYKNTLLGIGTSNASTSINGSLTISTTQSNTSLLANQLGTGNIVDFQKSNVSAFTITNNGNIGVGKFNPTKKFDVEGDINFKGMIYQDNVIFPREPFINTFTKASTKSKDYEVLLSWVNDLSFSNVRNLKSLLVRSYVLPGYRDTSSNMSYSLRIYDYTNNNVLAEQTFSNQNPSLVQLTLQGLSSNTITELELHGKVGIAGSNLCVENMLFKYN
jgi:hypothetical protein